VVFLIGLTAGEKTCTDADVYVGGSRARFLLYVFHSKEDSPSEVWRSHVLPFTSSFSQHPPI
jgi:hypothetical protein